MIRPGRLALVVILFAASALAAEKNTFKSVTVGFEVTKPDTWHFVTARQNRENLERIQLSDEEFRKLMLKYARTPLVAMTKYREPYDDLNPTFKVNVRPYGRLEGADPKQILTLVSSQLGHLFKGFKIVQQPTDDVVSGITSGYMRATYSLQTPDGRTFPTTSEMWIVPRGDYFFMIGSGTRQDEKTGSRDEVRKILESVKIGP